MKNILFGLLTAGLLTSGLAGCNNKLNVQPIDSVDAGKALTNSADVEAALIGSYTGLQNDAGYAGYIQLMTDLLADDGSEVFVGTFSDPQQAQRKNLLVNNGFVTSIWLNAYNTINRTNNVLANLDKLDTSDKQKRVEGEAKFIRSLVYFDLVRDYAKAWNDGSPANNPGVPLVLTPTTSISPDNQVARNTVAEVYTQVITDLQAAEAALPASNGFLATKYAAAALLSRVYLQQGRYADAAEAANRVITSGNYSLNSNYSDNFLSSNDLLPNSAEDIFAIQFSSQSGSNQLNTFYSQNRRADVEIQDQFINQFAKNDSRLNVYTVGNPSYTDKYDALYGNIKLIRLDEMYLTRAEGNFRASTAVGATPLADINVIRKRAGLAPLVTLTLTDILTERRKELAFEGFRLGDLKRNMQSAFDPLTKTTFPWNSPKLIFPIPLREINANPKLVQNEGYQ